MLLVEKMMWRDTKCRSNKRLYVISFLFFIIFLLSLVSISKAADIGCGRDTDRNGSMDLMCAGPDADSDGYRSVADGGTDCNDADWKDYPGKLTATGCSAGQLKLCTTDGTYGNCTAYASVDRSGTGTQFWVDDAETDCTGVGSYPDPEDYRCWFNSGMSGYHAPACGDAIGFQPGNYTTFFGLKQIFLANKDCSAGDPVRIFFLPGVTFNGAGVSPTTIPPVEIDNSKNIILDDLVVDGNYGEAGIHITNGSVGVHINSAYIYDTDGNCGTNNCGAIKSDNASSDVIIYASQVQDTYNRAAPTNDNAPNIVFFRGTGNQVLYSTILSTATTFTSEQIFYKHCDVGGNSGFVVRGNIFSKGAGDLLLSSCGGMTIDRNLFLDTANGRFPISLTGGNGATYWQGDNLIEYNTGLRVPGPQLFNDQSDEQSTTFGVTTVRKNIFSDNRGTAYPVDGTDGFLRVAYYGDGALLSELAGKVSIDMNCYRNSAAVAPFFTYFGNTVGPSTTNFATWKGAGFDNASYIEDMALDTSFRATSANCENWGWRTVNDIGVPTPTPTATPPLLSAGGGIMPFFQ